jgi:hypothetical protein
MEKMTVVFAAEAILETEIGTQFLFLAIGAGYPDGGVGNIPGPSPCKDTGGAGMSTISSSNIVGTAVSRGVRPIGLTVPVLMALWLAVMGTGVVTVMVALRRLIVFK